MKYLTALLLFCFSLQLNGQELSNTIPNPEPGKVYAKAFVPSLVTPDSLHEQLYKITPAVFETVKDTIYFDQFDDKENIRVMTKDPSHEWVVKKLSRNCTSRDGNIAVVLIEKPARWETMNFDSNKAFKIIKVEKIKTPCTFNAIDNIEDELVVSEGDDYISWIHDNDTYIKTAAGKWTQWKEVICGEVCGGGYTVKKIKEKLKEKGYYHGPIDNELDDATKAALTQLAIDNNLVIGQLDFELLKILGVAY